MRADAAGALLTVLSTLIARNLVSCASPLAEPDPSAALTPLAARSPQPPWQEDDPSSCIFRYQHSVGAGEVNYYDVQLRLRGGWIHVCDLRLWDRLRQTCYADGNLLGRVLVTYGAVPVTAAEAGVCYVTFRLTGSDARLQDGFQDYRNSKPAGPHEDPEIALRCLKEATSCKGGAEVPPVKCVC